MLPKKPWHSLHSHLFKWDFPGQSTPEIYTRGEMTQSRPKKHRFLLFPKATGSLLWIGVRIQYGKPRALLFLNWSLGLFFHPSVEGDRTGVLKSPKLHGTWVT